MSSKERFPVELHKLALVLVFLVIAALSNWMALAYIHDFIGRFFLFFFAASLIRTLPELHFRMSFLTL
jgi:hypothetical protein